MANKTVTVRPSGGDYTTLQAAITGEVTANANLVTMAGILTISIEGTWLSDDTTACNITGFTVNSSYYVKVVDSSLSKSYHLRVSSAGALVVSNRYTKIIGVRVSTTAGSSYAIRLADAFQTIDSCIVYNSTRGIYITGDDAIVANCLVSRVATRGIYDASNTRLRLYNNTITNSSGTGIDIGSSTNCILINNYSGGNTSADYTATGSPTVTTCYSEDGTLSTSIAAYTTSTFKDITVGSEDFGLVTGSGLISVGTDLRSDATWPVTVDIEGTTRAAIPCVGAYEYATSSNDGSLAIAQKNQSTAIAGSMTLIGTLAISQKKQIVSIVGTMIMDGSISIVQKKQAVNIASTIPITGTISIVQKKQSVSISELTFVPITLTLSALYDEDMVLDAQYIESITLTPQEDIP